MKNYWLSAVALVILIVGAVIALTSGGVNSSATKNRVENNWTAFFNGATSAQDKINLLQNGQQYAPVIDAQAQTPTAKATTATVSRVSVSSSGNSATVTYTIDINKQPALSNQTGQAVNENGTWKVGDAAFCGLLQLSGTVPPNCPGASSSY